jgi:cell division protein FtsA
VRKLTEKVFVAIDLGSSKVATVVGEITDGESVKVMGFGYAPSQGLKDGQVINIEKAVQSIRESVNLAEKMAGIEIKSAFVGITGEHIKGISSKGFTAVTNPNEEIQKRDVENVLRQAKAISIPMGREVIYVHPNTYIVDEQRGIKDPIGMIGVRLEVETYILTAQSTVLRNVEKTFERAEINPLKIFFQPIAASIAVLEEEEMNQGVALVDIGKGTTDIAVWYEGNLVHTASMALGGDYITSDIAHLLRTPKSYAEELKIKYGTASERFVKEGEKIKIEGIRGRKNYVVERKYLAAIIESRLEEILRFVHQELLRSGYLDKIGAGVVLVGGTALLRNIQDFAEELLNLPVVVGKPKNLSGLVEPMMNPAFAVSIGLLKMGHRLSKNFPLNEDMSSTGIIDLLKKIWQFMKDNF